MNSLNPGGSILTLTIIAESSTFVAPLSMANFMHINNLI